MVTEVIKRCHLPDLPSLGKAGLTASVPDKPKEEKWEAPGLNPASLSAQQK